MEYIFHTRFLTKGPDGYEVSGEPGVALSYLPMHEDGWIKAREWYERITATDTVLQISGENTLEQLERKTLESLGINTDLIPLPMKDMLRIGTKRELAWFSDYSITIGEALINFIQSDVWYSYILLRNTAGEVLKGIDKNLRYFIRSNEQGHNLPHVHVSYIKNSSASISILDGALLAGDLPYRALKVARKRIQANRNDLLRYWNAHTNGIKFDLNYYFSKQ